MTREDQIKKASEIIAYGCSDELEAALIKDFPELKESEDERISSFLYEFIKICDWSEKQYPPREKCLAYLEKQKEPHILNWRRIEEATTKRTNEGDCVTTEKMLIKGWINDEDYYIINKNNVMVNKDILCVPVRELNAKEKQKERKPAEKQDYSELTELERAIHRGFLCAGVENVPVEIIKGTAQECRLVQMKPAEWSEKEKGILLECISALQNRGHWLLADKLSSLRPQPHWKPSEEQMIALRQAISGCSYDIEPLVSLENQLKQLEYEIH